MTSILIVDHELHLMEITNSFLEDLKRFAVDTSGSGKEAIDKVLSTKYDAIVSEYQMPGMNGIELLKWMRSRKDMTPFIFFTANGNEEAAIEALNSGADFYLRKGDDPKAHLQELLVMIDESIQSSNSTQEMSPAKDSIIGSKLDLLSHITVHDIQNQIIVLNGLVYKAKHANSPVQVKEYLTRVQQVADKIQSHISFAREYQNLGKAPPSWVRLESSLTDLAIKFDSKWVQFEASLGSLEVYSDAMLNRAFYNLIDDTMKHGQRATKIKVSATRRGDELVILYEDNGVGVPIDRKRSIFEKGSSSQKVHGLVLVREILGITGMTIEENGEPGIGARFEIVVPKGNFRYPGNDHSK
jgi:DNA-binding response OmpR family regulator